MTLQVALGVCTYKRPAGLLRLLRALPASIGDHDIAVFVIDNDGSDPDLAAEVAKLAQSLGLQATTFTELEPGISAARNRALTEARARSVDLLAMLDDDEWPLDGWLDALMTTHAKTGAAAVSGIVKPVFPDHADNLTRYAKYWSVYPQMRDGRPFVHATSNVLLDLRAIDAAGDFNFRQSSGLSGGGDTIFFAELFDAGLPMAYATDAVVLEDVPDSRATVQWMSKRRFRIGNHMLREETLRKGSVRPFLKTLGLCARLPIYPFLGREPGTQLLGWRLEAMKIAGRFTGHFGNTVMEYARDGNALRRSAHIAGRGQ